MKTLEIYTVFKICLLCKGKAIKPNSKELIKLSIKTQ